MTSAPDTLSIQVIIKALGGKRTAVFDRAAREGWAYTEIPVRGGKQRLYRYQQLPADVRQAVAQYVERAHPLACSIDAPAIPESTPEPILNEPAIIDQNRRWLALDERTKSVAQARGLLVTAWREHRRRSDETGVRREMMDAEFVELFMGGKIPGLPRWVYGVVTKISVKTLYRWGIDFDESGYLGLAPSWGQTKGEFRAVSAEVGAYIVACIGRTPHIRQTHLHELCAVKFGADCPSKATIARYASNWKAKNEQTHAMLLDPRRWKSRFQPAFAEAAAAAEYYGHRFEADSTKADIITADGTRCALVAVLDVYSRRARLVVAPTSRSTAIAAGLRAAILEFGVPGKLRIDNGKDYASAHILQACASLGIDVEFGRPYHGEDKPHVERFFGTLTRDLFELTTGFCGHSVAERAALREKATWASKIMAAESVESPLTMAQLQELLDKWLVRYESKLHRGLGVTPLERSHESARRSPKAPARALDILLAPAAHRIVGKKGIAYEGGVYQHEALLDLIGQSVELRLDLTDAGTVHVFRRVGKFVDFVCTATDEALGGMTREVYHEAKNRQIKLAKRRARAVLELGAGIEDPVVTLLGTGEQKIFPARTVVPHQAKADTPMIRAAEAALREPEKPKGLVDQLAEEAEKIVDLGAVRAAKAEQDAPKLPFFELRIDIYDWYIKESARRPLTSQEREHLAELANYPSVQSILELRDEPQTEAM